MPRPIRLARPDEVRRIQQIEDDAGLRFATVGIPDDVEGLSEAHILDAIAQEWVLVATDDHDLAIGFALCLAFEEALHLHELDVVRAWHGQGVGSELLAEVEHRARPTGCVSLTTYRDITFNRPFYARRGYADWPREDWPEWMVSIRKRERAIGLDVQPRVVMRKTVHG